VSAGLHSQAVKRGADVVLAVAALAVLSPLLLLLAIVVALDSAGPVLYRDRRVGFGGRLFTLYKFRTMTDGSGDLRRALLARNARGRHPFMLASDPRVTPAGSWLRKASLDELPQLWNVLVGDMSLVGPRPLLPEDLAHAPGDTQDWKRVRQSVRPGITGPWQVRSRHDADAPHSAMVADDCAYVGNRSLLGDLSLLARTPAALLSSIRRG
jgi:lipopolysaccharide/colanic/teichoic acid biosynthesis glycosyltransferase